MTWRPLAGRVIVTRISQVTSDVLVIPDTYVDPRTPRGADRGVVLAATPREHAPDLKPGDEVFYLGPHEKLAIEWEGQRAYAVTYDEVIGVIVP
jgi:co-chaperonin GroES (HSP10)